jgi:hypothetical protein|tara:strand:+ start:456 stop:623 length:168 start_codon:yes stop_codon:yes gene_type:complete
MVNRLYNKQVSSKGYFLGGRVKKKKPETKKEKSIKEKILPSKKKKRLEELREMLK